MENQREVSNSGIMSILVGPFAYEVLPRDGVNLTPMQSGDFVSRAVCRNIDRMYDRTGKYDIPLRDIF